MTQSRTNEPMAMLFVGLLVGAAGALLYAPRSGRETRDLMTGEGSGVATKVKSGLDKVFSEVSDQASQASVKIEAVKGRGRNNKDNEFNRATPYTDNLEV